jgi:hypothetical protein
VRPEDSEKLSKTMKEMGWYSFEEEMRISSLLSGSQG